MKKLLRRKRGASLMKIGDFHFFPAVNSFEKRSGNYWIALGLPCFAKKFGKIFLWKILSFGHGWSTNNGQMSSIRPFFVFIIKKCIYIDRKLNLRGFESASHPLSHEKYFEKFAQWSTISVGGPLYCSTYVSIYGF